jgi:hypothetical protein
VFRALRKVYASFYNDNAVLDRLRLGVNEDQVGMALPLARFREAASDNVYIMP